MTCNRLSPFILVIFSVTLLNFQASLAQQALPPEVLAYADMVLYNGKVLSADDQFSIFQAIAVREGKILAVGDSSRILTMAGPTTQKVDLNGKSVIPGFNEVHSSAVVGKHGPSGPMLPEGMRTRIPFPTLDIGLNMIKALVDRAQPGEWVVVDVPINKLTFQLNRTILDTVAPNNPLYVNYALDSVVNSMVLEMVPPDMPGIGRDENGEPNGKLAGFAHGYLSYELVPFPSIKDLETKYAAEQKQMLEKAASLGITSLGSRGSGPTVIIMRALWARGELPIRIRLALDFARMNANAEAYFRRIGNLEGIGDSWLKIGGNTTESLDGTPGRAGLLTRKPKLQEPPNMGAYGPLGENKFEHAGGAEPDWREKSDYNTILLANRYGWNTNDIHARGDRAVDIAIEVFERADQERPIKGRRFGFVHGDMRTADQIAKLIQWDAILSVNPKYLFLGRSVPDLYKITYGADALHGMFPVKSLITAGLKPVIESNTDYPPDTTFTYLSLLEKFITRKNEVTGEVYGQDERISREEALWAATNWASRFYNDEHQQGTLEVGKLADMVILDGDYMRVPEENISDIPVVMTIVGGKVVYQRP